MEKISITDECEPFLLQVVNIMFQNCAVSIKSEFDMPDGSKVKYTIKRIKNSRTR